MRKTFHFHVARPPASKAHANQMGLMRGAKIFRSPRIILILKQKKVSPFIPTH